MLPAMCDQPPCMNIAVRIVIRWWPEVISAGITDHCFTNASPPASSKAKTTTFVRMIKSVTTGMLTGRRDASPSGITLMAWRLGRGPPGSARGWTVGDGPETNAAGYAFEPPRPRRTGRWGRRARRRRISPTSPLPPRGPASAQQVGKRIAAHHLLAPRVPGEARAPGPDKRHGNPDSRQETGGRLLASCRA